MCHRALSSAFCVCLAAPIDLPSPLRVAGTGWVWDCGWRGGMAGHLDGGKGEEERKHWDASLDSYRPTSTRWNSVAYYTGTPMALGGR